MLQVPTEEHSGWLVIALDGEADFSNETHVAESLRDARGNCVWLVVDCGSLSYCDSSFLNTLVGAYHHAQANDGTLVVAAAQPQLKRLLTRTGLTEVLSLYPSVAQAVSSTPP